MKKVILAAVAAMTMSTGAQADFFNSKYYGHDEEFQYMIKIKDGSHKETFAYYNGNPAETCNGTKIVYTEKPSGRYLKKPIACHLIDYKETPKYGHARKVYVIYGDVLTAAAHTRRTSLGYKRCQERDNGRWGINPAGYIGSKWACNLSLDGADIDMLRAEDNRIDIRVERQTKATINLKNTIKSSRANQFKFADLHTEAEEFNRVSTKKAKIKATKDTKAVSINLNNSIETLNSEALADEKSLKSKAFAKIEAIKSEVRAKTEAIKSKARVDEKEAKLKAKEDTKAIKNELTTSIKRFNNFERRAEAKAIQANHDARETRKKARSEYDEAYSI